MALELVSEYVIFTIFRMSVKHGKSFEMHVDVFFLKLQETCGMCSLTVRRGLGVVSFVSFV